MTAGEIETAKAAIEATDDLLERAMKLAGLLTTLFQERDFKVLPQFRALKEALARA